MQLDELYSIVYVGLRQLSVIFGLIDDDHILCHGEYDYTTERNQSNPIKNTDELLRDRLIGVSSIKNRIESNTYRKKYEVGKFVKSLQRSKYKLWLPEESRFLK